MRGVNLEDFLQLGGVAREVIGTLCLLLLALLGLHQAGNFGANSKHPEGLNDLLVAIGESKPLNKGMFLLSREAAFVKGVQEHKTELVISPVEDNKKEGVRIE